MDVILDFIFLYSFDIFHEASLSLLVLQKVPLDNFRMMKIGVLTQSK